ncbi:MAG: restriction endonuclease subunit S [Pseudomonadota bacterium]
MEDLPEGWKVRPLGEVCIVIAGQSPKAQFYNDYGEGLPFYQGKKEFGGRYLGAPTKWTTFVTKRAEAGDILMSVRAPVGPINESTQSICIGRGLAAIRTGNRLCPDYLWYVLLWLQPAISGNTGAVFDSINKAAIEALEITLPPLEEQRRIVAVLDETFEALDRARANAEANLQNARELLSLRIEQELRSGNSSWTHTTIGKVCDIFEYGTSSKSSSVGRMAVLRMGNLQSGEIDWTNLVYTNNNDDIEKLKLKPLDVLFNRTNSIEHVGKTSIYRGGRPAIFAGYLIRLHYVPNMILPEFLNLFLNSKGAREYGRTICGKSVNQANISASKLKTYPLRLPSLEQQALIVQRVACLREPSANLIERYLAKLNEINALRQSILQKAFAGELTASRRASAQTHQPMETV